MQKQRNSHPLHNLFSRLSHGRYAASRAKELDSKAEAGLGKYETYGTEHLMSYNYIWQPVDHFGTDNTDRFQQWFLYENKYRQDENNTRFPHLSGEWWLDEWMVSDWMALASWAKHYNASIYALEHRFYGMSQPYEDVSTPYTLSGSPWNRRWPTWRASSAW